VLFEKPTIEEIAQSLQRIVKGESLTVEDKVVEGIASLSDGAFRDGAKLLEELVLASKGEKITQELFDATFKTKGLSGEVEELLISYGNRDAKKALEVIARLNANGADFKTVTERIVDHLRGLLMLRNGIESQEKDIKGLSLLDIKSLLELSNEAYGELRISIIPQLPLELMSVKFCVIDADQKTEVASKKTEDKKEVREMNQDPPSRARILEPAPQPLSKSEEPQSQKLQPNKNLLADLITRLNEVNKPGAALLRSAKEAQVVDGALIITTPFPIHAERLKSDKVFGDLLKASEKVAGKKVEVSIKTLS
jgi:DNA polymerase III gamma/tau subunit